VDLDSLDIAVNAVATAVKDFFFKRLPPLLPPEHMADLETISVMQVHTDSCCFFFLFFASYKCCVLVLPDNHFDVKAGPGKKKLEPART
jgi:hypothetical protein